MNRLALLLLDIVADHLVRQIPRADRQVSPRPQMPPPERSPQVGKLLQQDARTDPFQPLHNPAHIDMRPVGHQHVNVVARHLPRQDRDFMLHRDLPNQVAHTKRHLAGKYLLPVFGNPHQVHLQIVLRVRAQLVPFHATTLHDPVLRLQGEGFQPSPRGTLTVDSSQSSENVPQAQSRDLLIFDQLLSLGDKSFGFSES